jgi:hypothetical protein
LQSCWEELRSTEKVLKQNRDYFSGFKIKRICQKPLANHTLKIKAERKWRLFYSWCDHFTLVAFPGEPIIRLFLLSVGGANAHL